jgi:hypothetical protein
VSSWSNAQVQVLLRSQRGISDTTKACLNVRPRRWASLSSCSASGRASSPPCSGPMTSGCYQHPSIVRRQLAAAAGCARARRPRRFTESHIVQLPSQPPGPPPPPQGLDGGAFAAATDASLAARGVLEQSEQQLVLRLRDQVVQEPGACIKHLSGSFVLGPAGSGPGGGSRSPTQDEVLGGDVFIIAAGNKAGSAAASSCSSPAPRRLEPGGLGGAAGAAGLLLQPAGPLLELGLQGMAARVRYWSMSGLIPDYDGRDSIAVVTHTDAGGFQRWAALQCRCCWQSAWLAGAGHQGRARSLLLLLLLARVPNLARADARLARTCQRLLRPCGGATAHCRGGGGRAGREAGGGCPQKPKAVLCPQAHAVVPTAARLPAAAPCRGSLPRLPAAAPCRGSLSALRRPANRRPLPPPPQDHYARAARHGARVPAGGAAAPAAAGGAVPTGELRAAAGARGRSAGPAAGHARAAGQRQRAAEGRGDADGVQRDAGAIL